MKDDQEKNDLKTNLSNKAYIMTCQYAINLVELKLRMLEESMAFEYKRNVISSITSRIKTPESIERKLQRKKLNCDFETAREKLNDIVGVRGTCFFEDDIYEIVSRLSKQHDIKIIKCKDYIKNPKSNGYKSYHLIIEIPVYHVFDYKNIKVEIQLRTVAMDFWAQLDYQLCYKKEKEGAYNESLMKKLAAYADTISQMDKDMLEIRKKIEGL